MNYTTAVETKKYLFLIEKGKKMYVIPKMSNYLAITSQWEIDNIVDVATKSYESDFPSIGNSSKVLALTDKNEDGTEFSLLHLNLSQVKITCYPLTSLLSYWWGEDTITIKFNVLGVNDEYAYLPRVIFDFNVFNVYNFGKIGSIFWIWIWINFIVVLLIIVYRLLRLGVKRRSQMGRIEGLKKITVKDSYNAPLVEYGEGLDHSNNHIHEVEDKPVLEMTENNYEINEANENSAEEDSIEE